MLILPKYRNVVAIHEKVFAGPRALVSGEFKSIMCDLNGRVVLETEWGSNLILDVGLNEMAQGTSNYMSIGDGDSTPVVGQTLLDNRIATTAGQAGGIATLWGVSPDYETSYLRRGTFGPGLTATVKEMGMHIYNRQNIAMYCRHLVTPTIPLTSDNILYVYYKNWVWPYLVDSDDTVLIGGVNYDTKIRASWAATTNYNKAAYIQAYYGTLGTGSSLTRVYDGPIGTVEEICSGASTSSYGTVSTATYVTDNHYIDINVLFGITRGNINDNFRSCGFPFNLNPIQMQFTATDGPRVGEGIPKDGTNQLDWTLRCSWDRYVP